MPPIHNLRNTWVQFPNQDLEIDAYLAMPAGEQQFPAVIVIQEIFGVNSHIREVTEQLAREGFVAIAPAIYQRLAPGFEVGYSPEETQLGRRYKDQTRKDELLSDLQATAAYLRNLPQVKSGGLGCIGFCFGGHVAYLAATLPEITATASFYGGGIATMCPGGGAPTVTYTPQIHGTIYAFFGEKDPLIPLEQVEQIETALKKHHVSHQVFRYPNAGHGFCCNQRADYVPEACGNAWEQVRSLFNTLR